VAIGWDTKTDTPIMGYTTPPAQPAFVQPVDRNIITRFLADKGVYLAKESIDELMCRLAPAAQRQWVGLTDEETIIMSRYDLEYAALIGEVERKLKEKNGL
jgi:hypothetical protein